MLADPAHQWPLVREASLEELPCVWRGNSTGAATASYNCMRVNSHGRGFPTLLAFCVVNPVKGWESTAPYNYTRGQSHRKGLPTLLALCVGNPVQHWGSYSLLQLHQGKFPWEGFLSDWCSKRQIHIDSYLGDCWVTSLTHWPREIWKQFYKYIIAILSNSYEIATEPHWWWVSIGSGNGLVVTGNKPLPQLMMTQIYVVTRPQWVKLAVKLTLD